MQIGDSVIVKEPIRGFLFRGFIASSAENYSGFMAHKVFSVFGMYPNQELKTLGKGTMNIGVINLKTCRLILIEKNNIFR